MDIGVEGDEREPMVDGVGDKHPVKVVAVDPWQVAEGRHDRIIQIVPDRAKRGFRCRKEFGGRRSKGQFAEAVRDLDFQHGDLVKDNFIGRIQDRLARGGAEIFHLIDSPQKNPDCRAGASPDCGFAPAGTAAC